MKHQYHPVHDNAECEKIIDGTFHGIMVFSCGDDAPYGVPLNHAYYNGRFYFHCAPHGRKLDCIRRNPKVTYIIKKYYGDARRFESAKRCHGNWESVIATGRARIIEEREELKTTFRTFMKYYGEDDYKVSEELLEKTRAIVVDVEEMSARRELEETNTEYFIWKPKNPE